MSSSTKDIGAIFLILCAPLLPYLFELGFPLFSVEVGAALAGALLLAVGLRVGAPEDSHVLRSLGFFIAVLLFIDIQFDVLAWWGKKVAAVSLVTYLAVWLALKLKETPTLLLATFGVFNLVTVAMPLMSATTATAETSATAGAPDERPIVVHIVLDEHIGIEGLPTDVPGSAELGETLKALYRDYGFELHGGAYSPHFDTNNSISSALNYDFTSQPESLYDATGSAADPRYALTANRYFDDWRARGYRIHVHQTPFLDYCASEPRPDLCLTFRHDRANRVELRRLPPLRRLGLIARTYGNFSFFVRQSGRAYEGLRVASGSLGSRLPPWTVWDGRLSPISGMAVLRSLSADIERGAGGTVYFAHVLLPHYPYVYDRTCAIKPVSQWLNRVAEVRTPESRQLRYERYVEQAHCTASRIREVLDRIAAGGRYEDARIVIHGDHGSRITLRDPREDAADLLSDEDIRDGFSTLFAAKTAGTAARYSANQASISDLLRAFTDGSTVPEGPSSGTVFLKGDADLEWHARAYPERQPQ